MSNPVTDPNHRPVPIPVQEITINIDGPIQALDNKPNKYKINSEYLQDYDNSMFLKEESLFIVASPAEIYLYDAVTLERYQIYTPQNVKNTDIITMMKENIRGSESVIYILYHSFEILELKLVKIEYFDHETYKLKPKYYLEFKNLRQVCHFKQKEDSIYNYSTGAILFANKNAVTGSLTLLSCLPSINVPLSNAQLQKGCGHTEWPSSNRYQSYAYLLRLKKLTSSQEKIRQNFIEEIDSTNVKDFSIAQKIFKFISPGKKIDLISVYKVHSEGSTNEVMDQSQQQYQAKSIFKKDQEKRNSFDVYSFKVHKAQRENKFLNFTCFNHRQKKILKSTNVSLQ